jgi:hypothetical protein
MQVIVSTIKQAGIPDVCLLSVPIDLMLSCHIELLILRISRSLRQRLHEGIFRISIELDTDFGCQCIGQIKQLPAR